MFGVCWWLVLGFGGESWERGVRAARVSVLVIFVVSVLKLVVAFLSGSVALFAGALNSFSAIFSSVVVWVGLRVARREPTERFPYGFYKAETFALLMVSFAIIVSSVLIFAASFEKFFVVGGILFSEWALGVTVLSAVVFLVLGVHKRRVGREVGSQALVSEGVLSMVDVYASVLVFVGILFAFFGFGVVEGLVGVVVSVYVFWRGLGFGRDAAVVLMDASPSPERVRRIREIAAGVAGVSGVSKVRLRKSGPVFFGELHAELEEAMPIEKVELVLGAVEKRVKEEFRDMESILIHVEAAHKQRVKVVVAVSEDRGWDSLCVSDFLNAALFAFVVVDGGVVSGFSVKRNEALDVEDKRGLALVRFLLEEKVDVLLAQELFVGLFHVLRDNFIQIYRLPEPVTVKEAVRLYSGGLLERMHSSISKV